MKKPAPLPVDLDIPRIVTVAVAAQILDRSPRTISRWAAPGGPLPAIRAPGQRRFRLEDVKRLLEADR